MAPLSIANHLHQQQPIEQRLEQVVLAGTSQLHSQISDKYPLPEALFASNINFTEHNLVRLCTDKLKELSLRNNEKATLPFLLNLWSFVPNLKKLDMSGLTLTDDVLRALTSGVKGLESLDMSKCTGLTEKGMQHFMSLKGYLLLELNVADCGHFVTDESLLELSFQNLRGINLGNCNRLTNAFFSRLTTANHTSLEYIDFSGIKGVVSGVVLSTILSACVHCLRWLSLERVTVVEPVPTMLKPLSNAFKLRSINLAWFDPLGNEMLDAIRPAWNDIRLIDLRGAEKLDALSVGFLLKEISAECTVNLGNNLNLNEDFLTNVIVRASPTVTLTLDMTPSLTPNQLAKIEAEFPERKTIRRIWRATDPTDSSLRVPLLPANTRFLKPKKKGAKR